jgi:ATP-dependent exoDNAse (exonuclease V) beta subunit
MTVHGAKGLEFPVTILAGFGSSSPPGSPPALFDRGTGALEVRIRRAISQEWKARKNQKSFRTELVRDVATPGFDDLVEYEREMAAFEELRLLYVACTRARDHLVVCTHHKTGTRCLAATLLEAAEAHPQTWAAVRLDPPEPSLPALADEPAAEDPAAERVARDGWLRERTTLLSHAARPRAVAPTTLAREALPEPDLDEPAWQRGRAATSVGRAVHGTLQVLNLATAAGLDAIAAAQASAEGVSEQAAEVAHLARAALDAPTVRAAAAAPHWKELYVGTSMGERVLEGVIDLLVETPAGLVVVDYKTDRVEDEAAIDAKLDRYRLQGAAYAVAVEAAVGRRVARVTFVFLRAEGGAIERHIDDLDAARTEVLALL